MALSLFLFVGNVTDVNPGDPRSAPPSFPLLSIFALKGRCGERRVGCDCSEYKV